ncbi:Biotin transporter [Balamuthia mandrillaris]
MFGSPFSSINSNPSGLLFIETLSGKRLPVDRSSLRHRVSAATTSTTHYDDQVENGNSSASSSEPPAVSVQQLKEELHSLPLYDEEFDADPSLQRLLDDKGHELTSVTTSSDIIYLRLHSYPSFLDYLATILALLFSRNVFCKNDVWTKAEGSPLYRAYSHRTSHFPKAIRVTSFLIKLVAVIAASLFIAACAQISFYLPGNKAVPVTFQTFAVVVVASFCGWKKGTAAVILYLAEGWAGLPFWATQKSGFFFSAPTCGYLLGFIPAALVTGYLSNKGWDRKLPTAFLAMLIGNICIYLLGVPVLANFVGWKSVWKIGLAEFLPGDAIKVVLATALIPLGWKIRALYFNYRVASLTPTPACNQPEEEIAAQ